VGEIGWSQSLSTVFEVEARGQERVGLSVNIPARLVDR